MARKCFVTGCSEPVLHNLSWRLRGPQVPGGRSDGYSLPGSGGRGTLAYSCQSHLNDLVTQGQNLYIPHPDEDGITIQLAEWSKALDALLALDFNPDVLIHDKLTGAESQAMAEKAHAVREKSECFAKLFATKIQSKW